MSRDSARVGLIGAAVWVVTCYFPGMSAAWCRLGMLSPAGARQLVPLPFAYPAVGWSSGALLVDAGLLVCGAVLVRLASVKAHALDSAEEPVAAPPAEGEQLASRPVSGAGTLGARLLVLGVGLVLVGAGVGEQFGLGRTPAVPLLLLGVCSMAVLPWLSTRHGPPAAGTAARGVEAERNDFEPLSGPVWQRDVARVVKTLEDNGHKHLRLVESELVLSDLGRLERLVLRSERSGFFQEPSARKTTTRLLSEGLLAGQWTMSFDLERDTCMLARKVAFANPLLLTELPALRVRTAEEAMDRYPSFRLVLGKSETGADVAVDLNKYPHLLGIGATGSGKSEFNKWLLTQLVAAGFMTFLLDGKNTDFSGMSAAPGVVAVSRSAVEHVKLFQILVDEVNRRRAVGSQRKQRGEPGWNRFPPIAVIVDELATVREEIEELHGKQDTFVSNGNLLLRQGRQFRMHMFFLTQEFYAATIPGSWKANLGTRISLGQPEQNTLQHAFPGQDAREEVRNIAKNINQRGRGVLVDGETKLVTEFQAPYVYSFGAVIGDQPDPAVRHNWEWVKRNLSDQIPKLYPRVWFKAEAPAKVGKSGVPVLSAAHYSALDPAGLAALEVLALDDPATLKPIPGMSRYDPFSEDYVALERGDAAKGLGGIIGGEAANRAVGRTAT